jgi:hypothetical protein
MGEVACALFPTGFLDLTGLHFAVGAAVLFGDVIMISGLGGPVGIHMRIEGPVGQIDAVQGVCEGNAFELVGCPPPALVPFAKLVPHLGVGNHCGQQAFRSDEIPHVVHRDNGWRAAEVTALCGTLGIEHADGAATLAFDGFFLLVESARLCREPKPRLLRADVRRSRPPSGSSPSVHGRIVPQNGHASACLEAFHSASPPHSGQGCFRNALTSAMAMDLTRRETRRVPSW